MYTFFNNVIKNVNRVILGVVVAAIVLSPVSVFAQAWAPYAPESSGIFSGIGATITAGLSDLGNKIIEAAALQVQMVAGALVWIAGKLLDWIVNFTIVDGASLLNSAGLSSAINETWVVFRDLGNMFFIFIILYLAFQLILGIGSGHWRSLGWIIIMALVINFSLFFTKVVIDASNLLALTFYQPVFKPAGGVASTFMNQLGLQTVWNLNDAASVSSLFGNNETSAGNKVLVLLGATVLSVITAFIFFALSVLLIMRFVYLILLMIFSPLAFACYVIPGARHHFSRWWGKLVQQAFFAPAVFLLLFVSFKILGGVGTKIGNLGSFGALLGTFDSNSLPIVFNFALTIFMFLYSLTLALTMGMAGAKTTLAWGKSLNTRFNNSIKSGGSLIGRNTVARLARYASEQEGVKNFSRSSPMTGQLLYGGLNKLQGVGGKGKTLADVEKTVSGNRSKFIEWATSSASSKPVRGVNLAPEEKADATPEQRLSAQETAALGALRAHPETVARARGSTQTELTALRTEQKALQEKLTLIRTNNLKAATDYASDLAGGKTLSQLQSELEAREKELLSSIGEKEKQDNDLASSLLVAQKGEQELLARGQARIDQDKMAAEEKENQQKEKIAQLGAAAGTSRFAQDRELWKKSFDDYGKKVKKKVLQKKSQKNKKTGGGEGDTITVSDVESFDDLPEEIQDIAKKALEKKDDK